MLNKYENTINCIYIDPPYNTGEDGFLYKDKYMSSSWNTMMYERMVLGNKILRNDGIFLSSIDDNEITNLTLVLDDIYGNENKLGTIIWNLGTGTQAGHFTRSHEYILAYAKKKTDLPFFKSMDSSPIKHGALKRISRVNPASEITFPAGIEYKGKNAVFEGEIGGSEKQIIVSGKMIFEEGKLKNPVTIRAGWAMRNQILSWLDGKETYDTKGQKVLKFYFNKQGILWYEKVRGTFHLKTVFDNISHTKEGTTELKNMFNERLYDFPKPTSLLKYLLESVTNDNDVVIDYFAGSGSTGDAILKINRKNGKRKYILIDMEDYFDNIMLKRIKKCVFSDEWKNGNPIIDNGLSHFIKYQYLENYEDVLNNIEFKQANRSIQKRLDRLPDHFITYMLDYETRESPTRLAFEQFKTPLNYKINTISGGEEEEEPVDLVETFNYLLGLHIDRLRAFKDDDRLYMVVYGKRGNEQVVVIWRDTPDLDLKRDKEFIEKTVLSDIKPDTVYINGDSYLENANPIEPEFKRLMGV